MDWLEFREPFNSWSHGVWTVLAMPATVVLWRLSRGDRPKQRSFLLFGACMVFCFGSSALYHGVQPEAVDWIERLDFIGVYLLIVGTVVPLCVVVLRGRWRWTILLSVCLFAAAGIGLRVASVPMSRLWSTGMYIFLGWICMTAYFELARQLSHRAVSLVLLGGILYTTGAALNFFNWPELWPGVFSSHEVWHLFVMAASLCFYCLMLTVLVPFNRDSGDAPRGSRRNTMPCSIACGASGGADGERIRSKGIPRR
ncbi:MAG TPA: hemolysin III family protein [Gemmataceae bacterium]|nr:hemolysin III family protein [Gemmataceae bacterium]